MIVTDVTHQLKYLTPNVFMTNSCFEWNCSTLTLNSIEVKEVNLLHLALLGGLTRTNIGLT